MAVELGGVVEALAAEVARWVSFEPALRQRPRVVADLVVLVQRRLVVHQLLADEDLLVRR